MNLICHISMDTLGSRPIFIRIQLNFTTSSRITPKNIVSLTRSMAQLLISSLILRFRLFCLVLKTINFEFELFIDNLLHLNIFYRSFCVYGFFSENSEGRTRQKNQNATIPKEKKSNNNEKRKWFGLLKERKSLE